jgi:hypothetical protein
MLMNCNSGIFGVRNRPAVFILVLLLVAIPAALGFGAQNPDKILLWDGFVLSGVNGKLVPAVLTGKGEKASDSNEPLGRGQRLDWSESGWFFELGTDVNDLRVKAPAGTTLELLPSSTLEKLIADVKGRSENTYKLFGWATRYKGENFIFPTYFLPVSTISNQHSQADKKPERDGLSALEKEAERPATNEPNDLLTMPKEIMERLSLGRIVRSGTPGQTRNAAKKVVKRDSILADRSAFLVKQHDDRLVFVLDAFGRNVRPVSLRLLPCEALETTELVQSEIPVPVRFKIAGIVTEYKGEKYLLLQRAARVYSHGNFAR